LQPLHHASPGGADIQDTGFNLAVPQPGGDKTLAVKGCRILAR
jgi:hypothetical protein